MTTEEFWEISESRDASAMYEAGMEFFSQELPADFFDDHEVGDIFLEIINVNQEAKNYENVVQISQFIREKHPEIYQEVFIYIDYFLVTYYCYLEDNKKAEDAFANFIKFPIEDFDLYLLAFKDLLFYNRLELLEKAVDENFREIDESERLLGDAGFDLSIFKYNQYLEELVERKGMPFDQEAFDQLIAPYNFEIDEPRKAALQLGLQPAVTVDEIRSAFAKNKKNTVIGTLGVMFRRYMYERQIPYAISGLIWADLIPFLLESGGHKRKPDSFFTFNRRDFEIFLDDIGSFWFARLRSIFTVLWGSVYVYDFLKSINIISDTTYEHSMALIKQQKVDNMDRHANSMWEGNFVHQWPKPDGISDAEFEEEERIFRRSFDEFIEISPKRLEALRKPSALDELMAEMPKKPKKVDILADQRIAAPEEEKIGRNVPCPCGSGKKYKKCCGRK